MSAVLPILQIGIPSAILARGPTSVPPLHPPGHWCSVPHRTIKTSGRFITIGGAFSPPKPEKKREISALPFQTHRPFMETNRTPIGCALRAVYIPLGPPISVGSAAKFVPTMNYVCRGGCTSPPQANCCSVMRNNLVLSLPPGLCTCCQKGRDFSTK